MQTNDDFVYKDIRWRLERPFIFVTISRIRNPSKLSLPQKVIYHLERIQGAVTRWVKGLGGLTYEKRLKALKLQSLVKNDFALTHKIIYNQIDLEATQMFKVVKKVRIKKNIT